MAQPIHVVPVELHEGKGVDVGAICWGSCGKGAVAGVDLGEYGHGIPCTQPAASCPHFDREFPGFGTVSFGDRGEEYEVTIRGLRAERSDPTP